MLKTVHAAALTAVATLLIASPAAAEPFQTFLKACMTPNGDRGAAIAAVTALGWKAMPAEIIGDELPAGLENVSLHLNFDPNGNSLPEVIEVLMTGQADGAVMMDAPGVMMDMCGVVAPGSDAAIMTEQVEAYFGGPAQRTESGYSAWLYSLQNGRITPEAGLIDGDDEALLEAAQQRPLFAVFTINEDDTAGLMLGAIRSTKGAAR